MYSHSFETRSGYKIIISENEGCMFCPNGNSTWDTKTTGEGLGVVTGIKYQGASDYESDQFRIFIYLKSHPKIDIYGDNGTGNGYYGWGFYVTVESIETI